MGNSSTKTRFVRGYYEEPWRKLPCDDQLDIKSLKMEFLEKIATFEIHRDATFLNILLIGQAGSGKSSYINTVCTAIRNVKRIVYSAGVLQKSDKSVTSMNIPGSLVLSDGRWLKVRLFDSRGLHLHDGLHQDDILNLCNGHIKPGYEFDPNHPIKKGDPFFRDDPELNDKMHCVVYVANSDAPEGLFADEVASNQLKMLRSKLAKF
ncbi:interferon-induced protein 44-like, partial [Saccostrea cucullata]|uniref:interferon-induced protein 44-like n=1 Tax=Saccostrea cuccullata TaxID=36930 RepID=UPI002ED2B9A3